FQTYKAICIIPLVYRVSLFECEPHTFSLRTDRCRHPHRSAQTSAPVGADIRIGRRRCPHRSTQMENAMLKWR
ncbi:hypothetical protein, partial [Leyella stercorea]|uniref:hypothetical protein n=1 Tax=Leyella stercorea TaxID=363265 RepID=UPI00242FBD49